MRPGPTTSTRTCGRTPPRPRALPPDRVTNEWTNANPQEPGPPGRWRHAIAYDAESDRVILFGGDTGVPDGETWSYDLDRNAWSDMDPVTSPSPRWGPGVACDSQSDRI